MEGRYRRVVDLVQLTGLLQTSAAGLSIDEIAERFEVSRRTAERMLAALRERFHELQPIRREGRKYWRLPANSDAQPLQLPEQLTTLSQRVCDLEAEATQRREEASRLRAMVRTVIGNSEAGVFVLDADFRVVWVNETLERYFGLEPGAAIGADKRTLIRTRLRDRLEDPVDFERRVLGTYDDNRCVETFECTTIADGATPGRRLQHWSQPITAGPYAGGRIEHYVELEQERDATPSGQRTTAASIARQIEEPLAALQESIGAALAANDPDVARGTVSDVSMRLGQTLAQLRSLQRQTA